MAVSTNLYGKVKVAVAAQEYATGLKLYEKELRQIAANHGWKISIEEPVKESARLILSDKFGDDFIFEVHDPKLPFLEINWEYRIIEGKLIIQPVCSNWYWANDGAIFLKAILKEYSLSKVYVATESLVLLDVPEFVIAYGEDHYQAAYTETRWMEVSEAREVSEEYRQSCLSKISKAENMI